MVVDPVRPDAFAPIVTTCAQIFPKKFSGIKILPALRHRVMSSLFSARNETIELVYLQMGVCARGYGYVRVNEKMNDENKLTRKRPMAQECLVAVANPIIRKLLPSS